MRLQNLKVLSPIGEIVSSADGSSSADARKISGNGFGPKGAAREGPPVALDDAPPSRKRPSPRIE